MAYGAAAVLGGAASTANSKGAVRVQKVVGGNNGEDKVEILWWMASGLKGEVLSFVLWWTFWTAIVHGEFVQLIRAVVRGRVTKMLNTSSLTFAGYSITSQCTNESVGLFDSRRTARRIAIAVEYKTLQKGEKV